MPDANSPRSPAPSDWSSAFATMGSETPPVGGWSNVSRALAARGAVLAEASHNGADRNAMARKGHANTGAAAQAHRARAPLWLTSAAGVGALAVAAMLLLRPQPEGTDRPSRGEVTASRPDAKPAPSRNVPTTDVAASPASAATSTVDRPRIAVATAQPAKPSTLRQSAPASNARTRARSLRGTDDRPVAVASRAASSDIDAPTLTLFTPTADSPTPAVTAAMPADDTAAVLASLFAESARLEAVIALANDDSVASGSGLVLAGELRDRIGQIDAALTPGNLDEPTRASLWQQRIDALRELAGLQSTQRWLAANGERYDGALVSVH